jgi:hypothetical protein
VILLAVGYWGLYQYLLSRYDPVANKADGIGCVSHAQLLLWYSNNNKDYFDNQLPHDTDVVWQSLRYRQAMGDTSCNESGCLIRLDPFVNVAPATAQETLLHESCHVATQGVDLDHGPEFQACIKMLFDKGAFVGLI